MWTRIGSQKQKTPAAVRRRGRETLCRQIKKSWMQSQPLKRYRLARLLKAER
jgi:hypothetical protein